MPLPTSRDFDAVDAGPLPHTTVNNIQDTIIALEAARIANRSRAVSLGSRLLYDPNTANPPVIFSTHVEFQANVARSGIFPFELAIGERLNSWTAIVHHFEASTQLLNFTLVRWGGSVFPVVRSVILAFETVPSEVPTASVGTINDQLVTGSLAALPVIGNADYSYGLFIINDTDGSGDTTRVNSISMVTNTP